jgi:hypothetical protein
MISDDDLINTLNEYEREMLVGGSNALYRVSNVHTSLNERYEIQKKTINIQLTNTQMDFFRVNQTVDELFENIYNENIKNCNPNLKIRMIVFLPGFFGKPVSTHFLKKSDFTPTMLIKLIDRAIQSKKPEDFENLQMAKTMEIIINFAKVIKGGGEKRPCEDDERSNIIDLNDYCNFSRFITVLKSDRLCLVRAILIAKAHCDKEKYAKRLKSTHTKLEKMVNEIVNKLNLPRDVDLGLSHLKQIEEYLKDYSIVLYKGGARHQLPIYFNRDNIRKKFLYILHRDDHYDTLLKIKSYFKTDYFCDHCQVKYYHIGEHKCELMCKACKRLNCESSSLKKCVCGLTTNNNTCQQRHNETFCFKKQICNKCNTLKTKKNHVCTNQKFCSNCKKVVEIEHRCFILTQKQIDERDKNKKNKAFAGFIFFDFEAYESDFNKEHVVNLAMAQRVCVNCLDADSRCDKCSKKIIYYNISDFVEYMLAKKNENFIFIAHNAKNYDAQFLINEFQKRKIPSDNEISATLDGTKLLGIYFRKICVKDSSLFMPMRLEQFPKAFGLKELKKGFFPYAFNKPENYKYNGPYPDKEYYGYNYFTNTKREEFLKWYETQVSSNKVINFQEEFELYCASDVKLLTEGCLAYSRANRASSKISDSDEGVCPFREKLTLASYCNFIYTRNYMPESSISMLPSCGFNPKSQMSKQCELWLKYISEKEKVTIKHGKNGSEKKIGKFFVDGYCEENKTIYEYQGCHFHGCPHCFSDGTFNPITRCLNSTLFIRTQKRLEFIQKEKPDFNIVQIWGHQWEDLIKNNQEVAAFVKQHSSEAPLYPRDALLGGRTNAIKLYHKCEQDETIKYVDYTSLYPFVMKYGVYPRGNLILKIKEK